VNRVTTIHAAGEWDGQADDQVTLEAGDRRRRRIVLSGERGTRFLLDLPNPATLRDGDGLVLDDGAMVRVIGQPEPLLELNTDTPSQFVRLAWHLGNRHADVQIVGKRLRIPRDHVLQEMAIGLGANATSIEAPFDPETGASDGAGHER
jgi:urease accessory protein